MVRRMIISAFAAAALASGGSAIAKPGGAKGKAAKVERVQNAGKGAAMRAKGRLNSRGPLNASARGIERSSANSVLKGSTVVAGPLTGLDPGDPVFATVDGNLREIGTVRRLVPGHAGRVGNVLVRTPDGRTVPVKPGSLTFDEAAQQWTLNRAGRGGG